MSVDAQTLHRFANIKKKIFVLQVHQISIFAFAVIFAFENKHWFEVSIFAYNVRYCTSVTFVETLVTPKF